MTPRPSELLRDINPLPNPKVTASTLLIVGSGINVLAVARRPIPAAVLVAFSLLKYTS